MRASRKTRLPSHCSARIGLVKMAGGSAAIYPGAPRVYAPKAAVDAIRARVHATFNAQLKSWIVDCGKLKQLPMLRIIIAGRLFAYFPREYTVKSEGSNSCVLLIDEPNPRYTGADWILGDPLFREHCLYLDFANGAPRIGFSRSVNNPAFRGTNH